MSERGTGLEAHEVVAGWRQEFAASETALKWVTLAEAEEATGVSRSTLRTWFRSGELPSRLEPGPHGPQRLIPLEAALDKARRSPVRSRPRTRQEAVLPEPLQHLVEAVLERAEKRAVAAEAAAREAFARAAAAEAQVQTLREQLRNLRQ